MRIKGIDISHHNALLVGKELLDQQDFVIMKATEGVTYTDPCLSRYYNMLHGSTEGRPDKEKCYGFYHYARPEKYLPTAEAEHFLNKVGHHAGEAMFILDWEQQALTQPAEKARAWMDYVYAKTGVKPLLYVQASELKKMKIVQEGGYGLWVAQWHSLLIQPTKKPWSVWALWQYKVDRTLNLDLDVFNGSKEQFKKYCRRQ